MKLKVVLALSTALAATPAVANPLGGALQSLGNAGNGSDNSVANEGNGNENGNPLISRLESGGMSLQDSNPGNSGNGNGHDANPLAALQSGQDADRGNGGDANPLAGLRPDQEGANGNGNGDDADPSAALQPDRDGANGDGNGNANPLAGLQPEQNGNDADTNGGGESPLEVRDAPADDGNGQPITIENEDDKLIVGVRLDGRDGILHEDIVPFASSDVVLSPEALSAVLYAEESDDWLRIAGLLSPERSFLDIEGEGDERVDTERENDVLRGLLQ